MHNQCYTPVRFSHLMSYAGIGAIVRGTEDKLMVVTDTRYWTDRSKNITSEIIPCVKRVSAVLGFSDKELRMPPKAKENEKCQYEGDLLPTVLFPTYAKCKKCGLLYSNPWWRQDKKLTDDVYCKNCNNSKLEQVTWCLVSSKGHLDDVPWHYICHKKSNIKCEEDYDNAYLQLKSDSDGQEIIFCTKCKSNNRYRNIKTPNLNEERKEKRWINPRKSQPWLWKESIYPELEEDDIVEILEVNNPGVYFPNTVNALVIPPESRKSKNTIAYKLFSNNSKVYRELAGIKMKLLRKSKLQLLSSEYRCNVDEIEKALENGAPCDNVEIDLTNLNLMKDEYDAFLKPLEDLKDDEDFVIVHKAQELQALKDKINTNSLLAIINMIGNHVIAKRLREIQVFDGFSRVSPGKSDFLGEGGTNDNPLTPPDIIGESNWLPAIELFGEGVFFTIDENILSKWEKIDGVETRAKEILKRYEKAEVNLNTDVEVTPRFLLLHTLSHLLIRELESTAGYPAASLKERIYCSRGRKMAGVLIYTTVADIVGSLGGIVESAEPKEFLTLMDGAFKHAQWCSLDPVCTEHEGQGPGWLNRAACHACCLIPEPSCDYGNVFLDRVFIKGSESLGIPNFLEFAAKEKTYS